MQRSAIFWLFTCFFCIGRGEVQPRLLLLDAALSGAEVVAVGERGAIYRSRDNALTWQRVAAGTRATLTGVGFAPGDAAKVGWAVGHEAALLATTDGGLTWAVQNAAVDVQDSFLDVIAINRERVIAIGAYGLFVETNDGGKTWAKRKILEDDAHLNRISHGAAGDLFIAGEHGTLLRSTDEGKSWKPLSAPYDGSFYGVVAPAEHTLLAYGLEGRVFRSTDDGANWTAIMTADRSLVATGIKTKRDTILLAGNARTQWLSSDDGKSFGPASGGFTSAIAELLELPNGSVLALGEAGAALLPSPR